jgi:hypothetical protein
MNETTFDREKFLLETWPEALESGEFQQCQEQLYRADTNAYCCLGVACELLTRAGVLPRTTWAGGFVFPGAADRLLEIGVSGDYDKGQASLAADNDRGIGFSEIAARIREVTRKGEWVP